MNEEERLKQIVTNQLAIDEDRLERGFKLDSLALDSLELVELMVTIEEEFDISLDDQRFRDCQTMGEMADLIVELIRS